MVRDGKILDTPWQWPSGHDSGDLGRTVDVGAPHAIQLSEQPLRPGQPLAVILGTVSTKSPHFQGFCWLLLLLLFVVLF